MYESTHKHPWLCEFTMTSPLDTCNFVNVWDHHMLLATLWTYNDITPRHMWNALETHLWIYKIIPEHRWLYELMTAPSRDTWLWTYTITQGHWRFCELMRSLQDICDFVNIQDDPLDTRPYLCHSRQFIGGCQCELAGKPRRLENWRHLTADNLRLSFLKYHNRHALNISRKM